MKQANIERKNTKSYVSRFNYILSFVFRAVEALTSLNVGKCSSQSWLTYLGCTHPLPISHRWHKLAQASLRGPNVKTLKWLFRKIYNIETMKKNLTCHVDKTTDCRKKLLKKRLSLLSLFMCHMNWLRNGCTHSLSLRQICLAPKEQFADKSQLQEQNKQSATPGSIQLQAN